MDFVLHGHFYQPPREDPWSGRIAEEFGAAPFRNWNERIAFECYRPFGRARVYEGDKILGAANDFSWVSFDVGPTLGRWLDRHEPTVARHAREGDHAARLRGGHGNALAHPYFHAILPLADGLDRATLIRWGLAEFEARFGREAQGLWLPETGADNATLADVIDHGLLFVVLAPAQAAQVRPLSGGEWRAVAGRLDTSRPYLYRHPDGSGRSLRVFFYDGELARSLAFGDALRTTANLVRELKAAALRAPGGLVHAAVDGETFGHHIRYGERVLAHACLHEFPRLGWRPIGYGEAAERHPATHEVALDLGPLGEGSSWSCAHGLGRWMRHCGCATRPGDQSWRTPLRQALDRVRDCGRLAFVEVATDLLRDPWAARDGYGSVLAGGSVVSFLRAHGLPELGGEGLDRALETLELQESLLAMYTSCGWFFDDIGGIESVLILRHAMHAIERLERLTNRSPREEFLDILAAAPSATPGLANGADVARRFAVPTRPAAARATRETPWLVALRRWSLAGAGAAAWSRQVLAELAHPGGLAEPDLERARDLFLAEILHAAASHDAPVPEGATQIGLALGFSPSLLRSLREIPPLLDLQEAMP
jgi:alpha-amylase/alpha-mannosidase (GH57 family)